ncbi:MAG: SGNH/GDSL hydrolase family protein [Acidimicrobiia bacterium]|nr:SGNH/GDSL hydrolase family protein [Acidimicrobiia bacterium]
MKRLRLPALLLALMMVVGACGDASAEDGDASDTAQAETTATTGAETTTTTQAAPAVLFIGNSLTYWNGGLDVHLKELAASADPPLNIMTEPVVVGGYSLESHWIAGLAVDAIREGTWDAVVLGGAPHKDSNLERYPEYVRIFNEEIEKAGARTVLYMTWEKDLPDALLVTTTEMIAEAHDQLAAELGVAVAPAGLAWERSMQQRPDLELYDDNIHPSAAGTYLTLCVIYATIFDQSPVGLPYQLAEMPIVEGLEWQAEKLQMTEDDVEFLQQVAWETVLEYEANQP